MVGNGSREGWMALKSGTLMTGGSVLEVVLENEIGLAPSLWSQWYGGCGMITQLLLKGVSSEYPGFRWVTNHQ